MSKYLDKEKLLQWIESEISATNEIGMKWVAYNIMKEKFDDHSAHNAVALLDELEIKLNEANRRIEQLEKEHDELWEQAQTWREESGN